MTIKRLAFICMLLTYFLIVFGGYVASSNSGMGCGPEWPLCNGEVVPVLKGATLIEFGHRIIGALLGILSLVLFIKLLRANRGQTVGLAAFSMLGLLIIQILLGAIVVVRDLPSIIITIHLIIAFTFLVFLIWIWRYRGFQNQAIQVDFITEKTLPATIHLNILLILLTCTVAFGAYIKHESFGMACGWLGCRQTFFPSSTPELLQTLHRGLAGISAGYILLLTYWSFSKRWGKGLQKRLLLGTLTVLFQLIIGAAVIETSISIPLAVLHLAIGTALFAIVSEARIYLGERAVPVSGLRKHRPQGDRKSFD
ncbi:COX15/CtaA family protein [Neobacillus sp. SAB-20_R2A]|uniref:COX15/CtaA family protein n=1 Tax=Neobacillus sp. SAB-20_R2A TaxID=3120519 RepID=UPI003C6E5699